MKKQILGLIQINGGGVSFVELSRLDGFKGDLSWCIKENIVFWDGMSEEFIISMQELLRSKEIIIRSSVALVYAYDGQVLNLPIAKDVKRSYKKPRWLPIVFWTPKQLGVQ